MKIADYFTEVSFKVDKASVAQVDKTLDSLEAKLKMFGANAGKGISLNLAKFEVNQKALNLAIGNALDIASARNTLEISKFHIDQSHLNGAMANAMAEATRIASQSVIRPRIAAQHIPGTPGEGSGAIRPRHIAAAGGIAGGLSHVYGPAIALGMGGYGLAELNKRNQEVVAAQLQSQAVVQQIGGTEQQGKDSFNWLRKTANRVGFNYLDASQDYNTLLSNITGSGGSVQEGQNIFKGFSELARTMKLGKVAQQRVFKALSDVSGKGSLQAQELKLQFGQALPGAESLFAQAYQNQLKETGKGKGDLTGQAAIQALLDAMKKGQVKSSVLNYAANIASERASHTLGTASQASQAEQGRFQNSISDLAIVASDAGVEEGFARIFRTLTAGLNESGDLVKNLAEGFNDVTKWADDLVLFPQDFIRALEGKDSLVADWLGVGKTQELKDDIKEIKSTFDAIWALKEPSWFPTLKDITLQLKEVIGGLASIPRRFFDTKNAATDIYNTEVERFSANPYGGKVIGNIIGGAKALSFSLSSGVELAGEGVGYGLDKVVNTLPGASYHPLFGKVQEFADYLKTPSDPAYDYFTGKYKSQGYDVSNMFDTPAALRDYQESQKNQAAMDSLESKGFVFPKLNLPPIDFQTQGVDFTPSGNTEYNRNQAMSQSEGTGAQNITNNFDINFTVDATLAGETIEAQARQAADALSGHVIGALEQAQVNYPKRE